ncbi:MAG: TPM domain-containing protein [Cytophagales bacterium]|nr:MAG: TPM domain-containing protein [Cytophagales bacterium]
MKLTTIRFSKLLLTIFGCIQFIVVFGQDFPERPSPPKLVNDFANLLSAEEQGFLENKLVQYNDTTSTQIAVVIMRSVGEYEIKDYAQRLAQSWGIGEKSKNNGIILLIAIEDRKLTIQTGYGLEGAVTDAGTKRIIEEIIKPNFKEKRYFEGIDEGTNAIILLAKGEFKAEPKKHKKGISKSMIFLFIIVLIIIIINASKNNKGKGGGNSGRYSSGGFLEGALLGSLLNGGGRGGSWGSGSGGGGFGGFGGGSFGGGGSSGDW